MNFLLKASSFSRFRLPIFNLRKISLQEGVYSHYNDVCQLNNEIEKIFSTEPFNLKNVDTFLRNLSVINHPLNKNDSLAAFWKIYKTIENKQLATNSNYYLYISHFLVNMGFDFDPTAILEEINSKGLSVDKNILHQILLKYSLLGDLESAKLLHEYILNNFGSNTYHYVFVICAAIRAKNFKVANEYRKTLTTIEPRLPRFMLATILEAYASICDIDKCIEVFNEIHSVSGKLDNPFRELYKMYFILAKSGASEHDLIKAIQFLRNYSNYGRVSITINNLLRSNLFSQAILLAENMNLHFNSGQWRALLRILILYHNPPRDIYNYFYKRAEIFNLDYIFISEEFLFEDALKAAECYFFTDSQSINAKLVSGLIYNASKSDDSILKLKTVLKLCRFRFLKPEYSSYLIVQWLDSIKQYYKMNNSTIIDTLKDEMKAIDNQYFALCCILNSLCNNDLSEIDQILRDYPRALHVQFAFNFLLVAAHAASNVHFDNIQRTILIFKSIISPNFYKMFFDRFIIVYSKRCTSDKVISMMEFLLANTSYELTNNSIAQFLERGIPEASFLAIKRLYDKNYSEFLKSNI